MNSSHDLQQNEYKHGGLSCEDGLGCSKLEGFLYNRDCRYWSSTCFLVVDGQFSDDLKQCYFVNNL